MSKSSPEAEHAFRTACRWIERRSLSEKEVCRKLGRKGYGRADQETTVARLRRLGLVDDKDLARWIAQAMAQKRYGPRRARMKLKQRGIDPDTAECAVEQAFLEVDEWESARRCALRKEEALQGKPMEKRRASVLRHLQSRGFSPSCVYGVLDEIYRE